MNVILIQIDFILFYHQLHMHTWRVPNQDRNPKEIIINYT